MSVNVAVVGATGAVGELMRKVLAERAFPIKSIKFLASEKSAGKTVEFAGKPHKVELLRPEAFAGDKLHRCTQLLAAIAFDRTKYIARQTLGMDTDERRRLGRKLSARENNIFFARFDRSVTDQPKLAEIGREAGLGYPFNGHAPVFRGFRMLAVYRIVHKIILSLLRILLTQTPERKCASSSISRLS